MRPTAMLARLLGAILALTAPPRRDERGLSQSAETAILLAGAVTVAIFIVTVITGYIKGKLPK